MDYEHQWGKGGHCVMCHIDGNQPWQASTHYCPGPKPAGNTGRHEVAIGKPHPSGMIGDTAESDGGLWDRLRADLNNLGAAYGPITEGVGEALVTFTGVGFEAGATYEIHASNGRVYEYTHPEPDFDAILLAARKKRERANHNDQCDRDIARSWDGWQAELDRSQMLEAAMSRPLDWEPRVGHRGVPL